MKRARLVVCFAMIAAHAPTSAKAQRSPIPAATPPAARARPGGLLVDGLEAARTADYVAAEKHLSAVTGDERPLALVALARLMLDQGRFADAEKLVATAMATPAQKLVAAALRAEIFGAQGKVDEAIRLLDPMKSGGGVGGRRVRLVLGELLIRAGRRSDAEPILLKFADEYGSDAIALADAEGLAMVGRAMHLLRRAKDANRAYNESERAERGRVETLLWRADLYVDKYDPGHAAEVLTEALKIAPQRAAAKVMLARVKLEDAFDFDAAEALVREAIQVNPKNTGAYAVRAAIALRDGNIKAADAALDAALSVDGNDLEALSLRAAVRFVADDKPGYERAKAAVFARNAEFSQFYGIVGDSAEWEHRYGDVVTMMKEAVALDRQDSKAWAELGLMQTRAGDESGGVTSLEQAWKGDHFNVRVYNTLELLYGQWVPRLYESARSGLFDIRYPKSERAILQRYLPRMLGQAWGAMKTHYMFSPSAPVAVELYAERQHFSVRTSGLPNIGIQGVCFGRVVAAMSPSSEPFNWGNVMWHELAHVFAIQLSNSRVPRWFTEGLSEYETMTHRPEWQRELDPEFYLAVKNKRLPGMLDMNTAFTHSGGGMDVTVAYYAASQMLVFAVERFGFPRITHALELWGRGHATEDVIHEAFGLTATECDEAFRAWAMKRLARYDGQYMFDPPVITVEEARAKLALSPQSGRAHVTYGVTLLRAHRGDDARHEMEEALRIDPHDQDAHFVMAKLAAAAKNLDDEGNHLAAIRAAGGDGYTVEMALAEVAGARKSTAGMAGKEGKAEQRAAWEAAHRFDPSQVEPLRGLYDLAAEEKRDADSLAILRNVARLDQHDRRAWALLLDRLDSEKRWEEAKRVGEGAIYVDVTSAKVHVGYARALAALGEPDKAAFELETALMCDAKPDEKATAHALLAKVRLALGDAGSARAHRDEALRLDPTNEEAKSVR